MFKTVCHKLYNTLKLVVSLYNEFIIQSIIKFITTVYIKRSLEHIVILCG